MGRLTRLGRGHHSFSPPQALERAACTKSNHRRNGANDRPSDQAPARHGGSRGPDVRRTSTPRAGSHMRLGQHVEISVVPEPEYGGGRTPRVPRPAQHGLPLQAPGIAPGFAYGWPARWFFVGTQFLYWPSIAVSPAHVGGVMLACRTATFLGLTHPLAVVGRTALTSYLLRTIFYGHGLGLVWMAAATKQVPVGIRRPASLLLRR